MNTKNISLLSIIVAITLANSLHALPAKPAQGAAASRPVVRAHAQRSTLRAVATVAKPAPKAVVASPAARRPVAAAPAAARAVADEFQSLSSPGLFNGGNNCFINTALQCTFASPALVTYLQELFTNQTYAARIAGSPVARTLQPVFAAYCSGRYGTDKAAIPTAIISPFHAALRGLFTHPDDANISRRGAQGDANDALALLYSALNTIKPFPVGSQTTPIRLNVGIVPETLQNLITRSDDDNYNKMLNQNYLILNLNRVANERTASNHHRAVKRLTPITANQEIIIRPSEELARAGMTDSHYRLVALGYHTGSALGGHWFSHTFNPALNAWEARSDSSALASTNPCAPSAHMSLAVYERIYRLPDLAVAMPHGPVAAGGAYAAAGGPALPLAIPEPTPCPQPASPSVSHNEQLQEELEQQQKNITVLLETYEKQLASLRTRITTDLSVSYLHSLQAYIKECSEYCQSFIVSVGMAYSSDMNIDSYMNLITLLEDSILPQLVTDDQAVHQRIAELETQPAKGYWAQAKSLLDRARSYFA